MQAPISGLSPSVVCPVIIGREAYLDAIDRSLSGAQSGQSKILVLVGEAGIGKSRLAREAIRRATDRGVPVLGGTCFESDGDVPYAPLLDLLRRELFIRPCAGQRFELDPLTTVLSKLSPELARWHPGII